MKFIVNKYIILFTIVLLVTGSSCDDDDSQINLGGVPTASFEIDSISNCGLAPATISFLNTSLDADIFYWNFADPDSGDNNIDSTENPSHTFNEAGFYNVQLTAINSETSEENIFSNTISVIRPNYFVRDYFQDVFGNDIGNSLVSTSNNGLAIVGSTNSNQEQKLWFLLIDDNGNIENEQVYGETDFNTQGYSITETLDGGFAILGSRVPLGSQSFQTILLILDESGEIISEKFLNSGIGKSVIQLENGGYAITGTSDSDIWLLVLDDLGNSITDVKYGNDSFEEGNDIIETTRGELAIVGQTFTTGSGQDLWLLVTDLNGNIQVDKKIHRGVSEDANAITEIVEGGFAITGYTRADISSNWKLWLVVSDENGNIITDQVYTNHTVGRSIIQSVDGRLCISGVKDQKPALLVADISGNVHIDKKFSNDGAANSIIETCEKGFGLTGFQLSSSGSSNNNLMLIRTDRNGNVN